MHKTTNNTTTLSPEGNCSATVVGITENQRGERITTWELVYPRYIHSELLTHRAFSRNASSSRATPVGVMADEVINDPVFFEYVGKNQSGMTAGQELSENSKDAFHMGWNELGRYVAYQVKRWSKEYGIHKQNLNRLLEPWMRIRTLVTATDLSNFYQLRISENAQPEMRALAECMKESASKAPFGIGIRHCEEHIPYLDFIQEKSREARMVRSVAACARVCVMKNNGTATTLKQDYEFVKKLWENGHLSPFEHVALASPGERHANFYGWMQLRGNPAFALVLQSVKEELND